MFFLFDVQGLAPIGYTLFAVALGILAGTVWRKVLGAMAAVLVGFLAVRIAITVLARPNYRPPRTLSFPIPGINPALNSANVDWVQNEEIRDAAGNTLMSHASVACTANDGPCSGIAPGSYNWTQYQPGSRFWLFQGIEAGIFVALAALLVYLALRRVRSIA